jgi:3-methyl-2-oxobutanoate hydroxymethyltransferase
VVLEKVPAGLAADHPALAIPPSASAPGCDCDGQVLVVDDMLGLFTDFRPKFVKRYAELGRRPTRRLPPMPPRSASRAFPGPSIPFPDELPVKK